MGLYIHSFHSNLFVDKSLGSFSIDIFGLRGGRHRQNGYNNADPRWVSLKLYSEYVCTRMYVYRHTHTHTHTHTFFFFSLSLFLFFHYHHHHQSFMLLLSFPFMFQKLSNTSFTLQSFRSHTSLQFCISLLPSFFSIMLFFLSLLPPSLFKSTWTRFMNFTRGKINLS